MNIYLISSLIAVLGLFLGIILKKRSIKYHGPSSSKVRKRIFKDSRGCFKLKPVVHVCPINISMSHR